MRSISSYGDDEGDRWPHKRSDKIAARWGSQGDNVAIDKDVPALQCAGSESLGVTEMTATFKSGMPSRGAFAAARRIWIALLSTASAASALAPPSLRGLDGEARSAAAGRRRRRIVDFEHPAHHIVDKIDL